MSKRRAAVTNCPACDRIFRAPESERDPNAVPHILLCGHSMCLACTKERTERDSLLDEHVVLCTVRYDRMGVHVRV